MTGALRRELQPPEFQIPVLAWLLEEASQPEPQRPEFRPRALAQAGRLLGASEFRSWAPEWSVPVLTERRQRL